MDQLNVWLPLTVASLACLGAAATDLWKFKIPNVLTLPLLASGLMFHLIVFGSAGLGKSSVGALVGFGCLLLPYLRGGMGAGDVKLMAGIGAWLGPLATCQVLIVSSLIGGVYALGLWIWNRLAPCESQARNLSELVVSTERRRKLIPFGAAIAAAVLVIGWWR